MIKVFRGFEDIPHRVETVITVGSFDGVHNGHRELLSRLKHIANQDDLRAVALTFDPHPQIALGKNNKEPIKLLSSVEEKIILMDKFGVENLLLIPFTLEFSKTKPETFIRDFLYSKIGISKILIGYDHLFGKDREGDFGLLEKMSRELGFDVERLDAIKSEQKEEIISSTKIRKLLLDGQVKEAKEMLGDFYLLRGIVAKGDGRGATLGFPTANVNPLNNHKLMPANGVYCVKANYKNQTIFGMANIGIRPTFVDSNAVILEVNFFDFDKDIYGETIDIYFVDRIRDEFKFNSKEDLIGQLAKDKEQCLSIINTIFA